MTTRNEAPPFHGWHVVASAFMVLFVVYGLQFSFGTFVDDVVDDTGWRRRDLQLVFAVYVAGYAVLSMVSGTLTDRIGPRRVIGAGAVILASGYAIWAAAGSIWVAALGLGVIAPIGMSAAWVPCNATVVRWFDRQRGLAVALTTAGGSVANIAVPPLAAIAIEAWGWRTALATMAGIGGVAMVAAASRMHRAPEDIGEWPDGDQPTPGATDDPQRAIASGMTVHAASRTRAFWSILAMYSLTFLVVFVPFVHIDSYAGSLGVDDLLAATTISAIGVGALAGRLIAGPVSDRIGRRRVVAAAVSAEIIAFSGMAIADGLTVLYPSAALFGMAYGATVTMLPALAGDYFGRAHVGAIVGRIFGIAGATAAVGPYVAQLLVDATDSFRLAFVGSGLANAVALALVLSLPSAGRSEG